MDSNSISERLANLSPAKRALLEQRLGDKGLDRLTERSIPVRASREFAPLSFAQQRLWFLHQLEPDSFAYNQSNAIRLQGAGLNVEALRMAFNAIVDRHEVLRTTFILGDGGVPAQLIGKSRSVDLRLLDLSACPDSSREADLQRVMREITERPFDLCNDLMLRPTLIRLGPAEHVLLLVKHHIATDGWSSGILRHEFATLYEAFSTGKSNPLPNLPIQYADYAAWQRARLQGEVLENLLSYWKKQLFGVPALQLPTDRSRPTIPSYRGAKHSWTLPKPLADSLKALSRVENATLFMTLLAAFKVWLHRHIGQEDIVVGTDVANRTRAETEGLIGFFVNLLVLRINLSGNPRFREVLRRLRKTALEAYAHQELPFDKLIEVLRPERSLGQFPLVQVLFVFQNLPKQVFRIADLKLTSLEYDNGTSKFDLGVFVRQKEDDLVFSWVYKTDLFDGSTIARMSDQFATLLESIIAEPDARLNDLNMVSEAERQRQVVEKMTHRQSGLSRFRKVVPKAIDLSRVNLVKTDYLRPGDALPLLVQPGVEHIDLIAWARVSLDFIETELLKHGAILFRDFRVALASEFENFASALCPELFGEYGDLPRAGVEGKVYESTPYPADQAILFHNESSHLHRWPLKLWFFCIQPPRQRGETPIVDCRKVYQLHDAKLIKRFVEKKIMYVRNFTRGLDVSWQEFFKTSDRSVVERFCKSASIDFEWKDNDGLRTRQICPAVTRHPKTREYVWFNQIQHWHLACLDPATRESLLSLFPERDLPRNCYYGDGSLIEESVIDEVNEVYRRAAVSFPWRPGDILMLDNMLTAHARNPYDGPRKIVVAMGQMIDSEDVGS
jgi:alpha-ketoglutarate-dependent taurine dioxygenase